MSTTRCTSDSEEPTSPTAVGSGSATTEGAPTLAHPSKLLFRRQLAHLQLALHPLLSVSSGRAHWHFPRSLLAYHLLTEAQLDELMHHYHQRTPGPLSMHYPAPVAARWLADAPLADKRRRFGRFIGLRCCESPVADRFRALEPDAADAARGAYLERVRELVRATAGPQMTAADGDDRMEVDMELDDCQTQEEFDRCIEERFRRAMNRENERRVWERKGF